MDHGVWPWMTTKFYIDQTGDISILNEKIFYYKDKQVVRGTAVDEEWSKEKGCWQKDSEGTDYKGTILEHLLIQSLTAFYEVGEHNHIRLRDADWNDALDMASERGESVAFTNAYAGNLKELSALLYVLQKSINTISLAKEIEILLQDEITLYDSMKAKNELLRKYSKTCKHRISGEQVNLDIKVVADSLVHKADWLINHIRETEWLQDDAGYEWYNGYYDNHGSRVEGNHEGGVRMMLTGQVFSIMSGTATKEQIFKITKSADAYLFDASLGGYRLNTNFHELKTDLGRMFGFSYGDKENGAVFSHMAVMYGNALYKRGFVKEGYKALHALSNQALNVPVSKIYPGIPEYFNGKWRGMYHYLTGAASWYMLTVITEMFGIKGKMGDLNIEPKLLKSQFDEKKNARVSLEFGGLKWKVIIYNPTLKEFGEYHIDEIQLDGNRKKVEPEAGFTLRKVCIEQLDRNITHEIIVTVK